MTVSSTNRSSHQRTIVLKFADSEEIVSQNSVPIWPSKQEDAALVWPRELYEQLSASTSNTFPRLNGRAYIAVDLPFQFSHYSSSSSQQSIRLPSLVLPIAIDGREQDATTSRIEKSSIQASHDFNQQAFLILPAPYRRFFPTELSLFESSIEVIVRPHIPLSLTNVILSAQSKKTFEYAQTSQQIIEDQVDGRLIRQDDVLSFGEHSFRVVMCEPILQGIASQEDTEVFVTYDGNSDDMSAEHPEYTKKNQLNGTDRMHDTGNIIVDEHFFTKGVLDSLESNIDDTAGGSLFTDSSGINFQPFPVQDVGMIRDALRSWSSRAWRDMSGFDVENCILLDEATFPQLGSFEGDWALVEVENEGKARAVKMLCAPRGIQTQLQLQTQLGKLNPVSPSSPFAFLSPLLLQNLYKFGQFDPSRDSNKPITLRSLGSWQMTSSSQNRSDALPDCPLPLPFADSLTISRIAGPLSINRKYQHLFLGALRTYFESGRRIVQQGDIFAVTFDKSKIRWAIDEGNEDDAGEKKKDETKNEDEAYDLTLPAPGLQSTSQSTGVVYFCVSDVTPEVSEPLASSDGQPTQTDLWIHEMARTGQFGCAVDTMLTKMVQSGVHHSRVNNTQHWLSTATDTPPLPLYHSPLTAAESIFGQLLRLVKATLLPDAADYGLHLSVLLKGARGCGKRTISRWVAQKTGVHLVELNCYDLIADTDTRTEGVLRARFEQAAGCAPAVLLLRHVEALARKSQALETGQEPTMATVLQNCMASLKQRPSMNRSIDGDRDEAINTQTSLPIAVIGTTGDADRCPTGVLACFQHELKFEAPNEAERRAMLGICLRDSTLSVDVSLKSMATQTAALVASDLVDLVGRARMAAIERVSKQGIQKEEDDNEKAGRFDLDFSIVEAGVALTGNDFEVALNKARLSYSENIGAPKIPNVTWDDVGGLVSVKDDILDTIQLPLEHPELFSDGLKKRSGILLYGPPGTGKTLLAKAVATSCSLNFFSVKGPELLNMYIGESEANVRRVFQRARDAKPCVIFFDELDSIAPKRGNQGDSGGVMDRIVSQLLAELDGMSSGNSTSDVFVIGATNRPDLLDPALLRPGRFDRMLYLAVSQTHSEQLNILQALTRKFKLDEDVGDLTVIAEQCPMNLTGADFYALCSDAMLKSMTRKAEWIDGQVALLNEEIKERAEQAAKNGVQFEFEHPIPLTPQYYLDEIASTADLDVKVSRIDFEAALAELVPSVSSQEMEHYRSVQQKFSNTDSKSERDSQENKQNGRLHDPIEYDDRVMEKFLATMQNSHLNGNINGTHTNGNTSEAPKGDNTRNGDMHSNALKADSKSDIDQESRKSKGKGKAKAID